MNSPQVLSRFARAVKRSLLLSSLLLAACGQGGPTQFAATKRSEATIDVLLDDLKRLSAPEGCTVAEFEQLKSALRIFIQQGGSRFTAQAPQGQANKVIDLVKATDETGTVMRWSYRNSGDYNQDGQVNIADLSALGAALGKRDGGEGWARAQLCDGDGNKEITVSDLTPLGANLLATIAEYRVEGATNADGPWEQVGSASFASSTQATSGARSFEFALEGLTYTSFRVTPYDNEGNAGPPSDPLADYILQPNARPVGYGDLEFVSFDGTILVVNAVSESASVEVGDVLAGIETGGYLIFAESVERTGDVITISGRRASLDEYVSACNIKNTIVPEGEAQASSKSTSGVITHTFVPVDMAGQVLYQGNGVTVTVVQGTVQFTPTIITELNANLFGVQYFEASAAGNLTYNFEVRVDAEFTGEFNNSVEFAPPSIPIPSPIPGIYAEAYLRFDTGIKAKASFYGDCGMGVGRTYYAKIGAAYHDGGWHDVGVPMTSTDFNSKDFWVNGKASGFLEAYVHATIGIRLNGTVGAELIGKGDVHGQVKVDYPPLGYHWSTSTGLGLDYSIYGGIWNKKLIDLHGNIAQVRWPIDSGVIPSGDVHTYNMYGGGPERQFNSTIPSLTNSAGAQYKRDILYQVSGTGGLYTTASSPVVDKDGNIYLGGDYGQVYCLAPDGKTSKWQANIGTDFVVIGAPALAPDGTVYIGIRGIQTEGETTNGLVALTSTGQFKWYMPTYYPVCGSPLYYEPNGTIYVAENNLTGDSPHAFVYAVGDQGHTYHKRAAYEIDSACWGSPAVYLETNITKVALVLGQPKNQLLVLRDDGGQSLSYLFSHDFGPATAKCTPVVQNGIIYYGDSAGKAYATSSVAGTTSDDIDGTPISGSPAVAPNGHVYFTTEFGNLQAYDASLNPIWFLAPNFRCNNGMVVSSDNVIYIPTTGKKLVGIFDGPSGPVEVMRADTDNAGARSAPCIDIYNGKPRIIHLAGDILYSWVKK